MTDNLAARFPVSIKGVVERDGRFVLLKNERDEWELPGGKLEPGEGIEDCLVREIDEELNLPVAVGHIDHGFRASGQTPAPRNDASYQHSEWLTRNR
jgi:8-oxo-dGTP pyrophosphatase MutT (NUDIX family)